MTVEFIGPVLARRESEVLPPSGPLVQHSFVTHLARAYEGSAFGWVQVGQTTVSADSVVLAHAVLAATGRLGVVITLHPAAVEPVGAARAVASLAALYPGRVRARVPAVPDDPARQAEFGRLLRTLWHTPLPVDHDGVHYSVRRHWSAVRPDPVPHLYVQLAEDRASDEAFVQHGDTCFLPTGTPATVARRIARLRESAGDRSVRFGLTVRPVIGADRRSSRWSAGWYASPRSGRRRLPAPVLAATCTGASGALPHSSTTPTTVWRIGRAPLPRSLGQARVSDPSSAPSTSSSVDSGSTRTSASKCSTSPGSTRWPTSTRSARSRPLSRTVGAALSTLSPDLVLLIGNPRPGSRTRALAEHVASRIASSRAHTLELAELTAISYTAVPVAAGYPDDNALDAVRSARVLVVATPSYKGTYTGLLKLFLDRLPHRGLEGVVALPVAVGASPAHVEQTASDLAALLVELGAEVPAKVAVLEAELESPDVGAAVAAVERSVVAGARP